jgi:hypothetical protein
MRKTFIYFTAYVGKKGIDDMITSQQVYHKLELLDPLQRETVSEFIDFLLSKQPVAPSEKKAILLQTSVWSEDSLQQIEEVQEENIYVTRS